MSQPRVVHGISPIVAVASVKAAVEFYVRHLGFNALFVAEDGSYGVAGLLDQSVHFVPAADAEALASTARHTSFRLRVEGLDAYWEQVSATHPPTRTRAPEIKPWGIREFHILDADGALIIVSEAADAT
ncbi:VOC family protein [Granulicella arctica]|uniref:VOC family protein n=1 Tax=Granulicella arctica TaxID=940613 RepID=UPI0021DFDE86|nr:VOC family protein [Granulicella arctica]